MWYGVAPGTYAYQKEKLMFEKRLYCKLKNMITILGSIFDIIWRDLYDPALNLRFGNE